ncbi:MAG TPA: ectoine/hydroxyectoine ABC transporter substrate-binding protein EhuB [Anaerolineae bacterium]|nr:ectoine/hydroxyectoine ABC transporter substrate-binding protein EhuB [Anaerolineae bacterium]
MKGRSTIALLLLVTLLATVMSCGTATPEVVKETVVVPVTVAPAPEEVVQETTLERAKREGVIRVGFANESPFAYANPDGTLTGEAVEVARAIFTNLGIPQMEGVLAEFGSLIPGLVAGRFDAITAGMYIKPERCEQVLFADPDYKVGGGLIVAKGNPLNLHSYEDIAANPNVRAGTGQGYYEDQYMRAVGVKDEQITLYPDNPSGIAGLQAGQIDAYTATAIGLAQILGVTEDPNLELADPFTDPVIDGKSITGYSGTAFRKEDIDLRNAFSAELRKLEESGKLLEIYLLFPGFGKHTLPGGVSVLESCPDQYKDLALEP